MLHIPLVHPLLREELNEALRLANFGGRKQRGGLVGKAAVLVVVVERHGNEVEGLLDCAVAGLGALIYEKSESTRCKAS